MRITPHGVTKITPLEAHKGCKPNTPLSKIATTKSPNNLNWVNAKLACLDQKILMYARLPPEKMHDLHCWSVSEVNVKKKHCRIGNIIKQRKTGVRIRSSLASEKEALNSRLKGTLTEVDSNTRKKIQQVARKTIKLATKVHLLSHTQLGFGLEENNLSY